MSSLQDVASFVRSLGTWMDVRVDDGFVQIDTRSHGDVGSETPGKADIAEGARVAKALREKFPEANVESESVDEWVSIMVDFAPKRYNSRELAAALKAAYPNAGTVYQTGGTYEIADAVVPDIGRVHLVSSREGGVDLKIEEPRTYARIGEAVRLKDLKPRTIHAAAKRAMKK